MKKKLLSQVVILFVFHLAGIVQLTAQCVGPMTVSVLGSGTGLSLSASESHIDAMCSGGNGSATITASGGTGPYSGTGTFPQAVGTHVYTVTDVNNCMTTVSVTIQAVDVTPPSIECPMANLTISPNLGGCTAAVVGSEYDPVVSDNCGVSSTMYSVVSGSVTPSTGSSLNGAILGSGANVIQWTVTDVNGLTNTCVFTVTVDACITLSGYLLWKGDAVKGVAQAKVYLSGDATGLVPSTPLDGSYTLTPGAPGDFVVRPEKTINPMNGIDVSDPTAIQQHLTGLAVISDPYRLVAADVNKSYSVTTVDAAILRQALLNSPAAINIINTTKSWRFIPTDYVFPYAGPYLLPVFDETRSYNPLTMSMTGQNFYGVKTGDVNQVGFPISGPGTANPALKPDPAAKPLIWRVRDRQLTAGESASVDFTVLNFSDIAAYQFGLSFDPGALQLDHIEVLNGDLALDATNNFGTYQVAGGELRTVWSTSQGATLTDITPVFRLHFTVLRSGKLRTLLRLDPSVLGGIAYNTALAPRDLQLVYVDQQSLKPRDVGPGTDLAITDVELLQNRPNPFSDRTTIGFILPGACDAQLRVYDLSGRELLRIDRAYPAGYSEETIRLDGATASGVLYYELTTPWGVQARKMLATGK